MSKPRRRAIDIHARKTKRRRRTHPEPPTWEQAEIARLKHNKRVADDLNLARFFNDVFNAGLTDRTMLVGSEINDRGQVVTLAIPMAHLRELCRVMKERVGVVAGSVPTP